MKQRWFGIIAVILVAAGIIAYKANRPKETSETPAHPQVVLVADLSEAGAEGDGCARIIRDVRAARSRGVAVAELTPDSHSELISRYRLLTIPTVLILSRTGEVVSRFEGESTDTISAISAKLEQLR